MANKDTIRMNIGKLTTRSCLTTHVGSIGGGLFASMLEYVSIKAGLLSLSDLVITFTALTPCVWLFVLLIFGVWFRYGIRNILVSSFFVMLFTAIGITIIYHFWISQSLPFIGFIVGGVIGSLNCFLCSSTHKLMSINRQNVRG